MFAYNFLVSFLLVFSLILVAYTCSGSVIESGDVMASTGNFHYWHYLSDGTAVDVEGKIKIVNSTKKYMVRGYHSHPTTDGQLYRIEFLSNENGFNITDISVITLDDYDDFFDRNIGGFVPKWICGAL